MGIELGRAAYHISPFITPTPQATMPVYYRHYLFDWCRALSSNLFDERLRRRRAFQEKTLRYFEAPPSRSIEVMS